MTDEGLPKAAIAMPVYLLFIRLRESPSSVNRAAFASFPPGGGSLTVNVYLRENENM